MIRVYACKCVCIGILHYNSLHSWKICVKLNISTIPNSLPKHNVDMKVTQILFKK